MGPLSAREPANANPRPSRIDFLPKSITSWGRSSYFESRTNWPTYFVRPGVWGKSLAEAPPAPLADFVIIVEAITPRDTFPKSRLRIVHLDFLGICLFVRPLPRRTDLSAMVAPRTPALRLHDFRDAGRRDSSDSIQVPACLSSRESFPESSPAERNGRDPSLQRHPQIGLPRGRCASASRRNSCRRPGPPLAGWLLFCRCPS